MKRPPIAPACYTARDIQQRVVTFDARATIDLAGPEVGRCEDPYAFVFAMPTARGTQ